MAWEDARDFLNKELASGTNLPVGYNIYFNSGPRQGQHYRVIVLPTEEVEKLSHIRKRAGLREDSVGGIDTVNFAPTGGCHCCGR